MSERYTVNSMFCDMINDNCTAVKNHKCFYADCNTCEFMQKAWNKLAHYEDLEEQGRLIELPCKVGDTVYEIIRRCKGECYSFMPDCDTCDNKYYNIAERQFHLSDCEYLKDKIFLTRAEAEAKLKEMEKSE